MGSRICPKCGKVVKTRVLLGGYKQVEYNGILVKARNITHRIEDGGCGCTWQTIELPVDWVPGFKKEEK